MKGKHVQWSLNLSIRYLFRLLFTISRFLQPTLIQKILCLASPRPSSRTDFRSTNYKVLGHPFPPNPTTSPYLWLSKYISSLIFFNGVWRLFKYTPRKINMEPENTLLEFRKIIFQTIIIFGLKNSIAAALQRHLWQCGNLRQDTARSASSVATGFTGFAACDPIAVERGIHHRSEQVFTVLLMVQKSSDHQLSLVV